MAPIPEEHHFTVDLANATIVGPDDRVILQCTEPNLPVEVVQGMQDVLNATFGPNRALIVVGDAMTVLVQRQRYGHDEPASFTLLTTDGETLGEHEP